MQTGSVFYHHTHAILHACDGRIRPVPSEEKCHEVKESMTMFGPSDQCPLRGNAIKLGKRLRGPSDHRPLRGRCRRQRGCISSAVGRLYGFLNDYGIPLSFRKPDNLASLVEIHPLWCLRHHLSPGGGTGPMDQTMAFSPFPLTIPPR